MRKESIFNKEKEIWDKPFTKKLALDIIKKLNSSHYSAFYEYFFEDNTYFGQQTWIDIEEHDAGWVWDAAFNENVENRGTHKDYHKLTQLKITEEAQRIINKIQNKNNQSLDFKRSHWRVACFGTTNIKNKKTKGYYLYNINSPQFLSNYVIVI